jgi:hypothetical protein
MAKRDRRGSSRSKPRRAKKTSAPRLAELSREDRNRRKEPATQPIDSRVKRAIRAPRRTASSQSNADMAKQRIRTGIKVRTPRPSLIVGELEEINLFGGRQQRAPGGASRRQSTLGQSDVGATTHRGGTVERRRTSPPPRIHGELEEIDLFARRGRRNRQNGPAGSLEDKAGRFRNIQDFFHNPNLFELRGKELGTSSTPEEIQVRTGEVRYQIEVMRSLLTVLTQELKALEQAQPLLADGSKTSQS